MLYRRALEGREKALGLNHPDTLASVNNLGALLYKQGHLEEAKVLFLRAFEGYEKAFGSNHPHTQLARQNLSILNQTNPHVFVNNGSRGNQDVRLEIASIRKALDLNSNDLTSFDTASVVDLVKLSCKHAEIGEYQEAKVLEEAILRQQRARRGDENMHTINAMTKLAGTCQKLGEHAKAIELCGNAVVHLAKFRGPKSKDTLQAMCDLATAYRKAGSESRAKRLDDEISLRKSSAAAVIEESNSNSDWVIADIFSSFSIVTVFIIVLAIIYLYPTRSQINF